MTSASGTLVSSRQEELPRATWARRVPKGAGSGSTRNGTWFALSPSAPTLTSAPSGCARMHACSTSTRVSSNALGTYTLFPHPARKRGRRPEPDVDAADDIALPALGARARGQLCAQPVARARRRERVRRVGDETAQHVDHAQERDLNVRRHG